MRLLVNALSARQGGIRTYTRNLVASLHRRGVDATFAVPGDFPAPDGAATIRSDAFALPAARRLIWEQTAWRRMVAEFRPDVLFSSANFGLLAAPCPQLLLMREGGLFDPFYLAHLAPAQGPKAKLMRLFRRSMMRRSQRAADLIMTPTGSLRDLLLGWEPALAPRFRVNLYGTLSDRFRPAGEPRPWRGDGVLRLLYVSVYYPHKCPGTLAAAAQGLNQSGTGAHATITMTLDEVSEMAGGAEDAACLAAADGAVTLGRHPYDALPSLYTSHDVFVFPSVGETFGHPLVEAMSAGLPVVAADNPVNREICGDAALYHTPFSARSLQDCLRALDRDPQMRDRMRRIGIERAASLFRWEDHVDRLLATLEETIAVHRGRPVTP